MEVVEVEEWEGRVTGVDFFWEGELMFTIGGGKGGGLLGGGGEVLLNGEARCLLSLVVFARDF